jgi:hypothetical protein
MANALKKLSPVAVIVAEATASCCERRNVPRSQELRSRRPLAVVLLLVPGRLLT